MSDQARAEHRRFHRVAHDAFVSIADGGLHHTGRIEDLSLKGCLVRLDAAWAVTPERTYCLDVCLTEAVHIRAEVLLVHQEGPLAGFRCVGIDAESIGELRRLVELNLGDSALLERDLRALLDRGA